jgi:hypothetical protein
VSGKLSIWKLETPLRAREYSLPQTKRPHSLLNVAFIHSVNDPRSSVILDQHRRLGSGRRRLRTHLIHRHLQVSFSPPDLLVEQRTLSSAAAACVDRTLLPTLSPAEGSDAFDFDLDVAFNFDLDVAFDFDVDPDTDSDSAHNEIPFSITTIPP